MGLPSISPPCQRLCWISLSKFLLCYTALAEILTPSLTAILPIISASLADIPSGVLLFRSNAGIFNQIR